MVLAALAVIVVTVLTTVGQILTAGGRSGPFGDGVSVAQLERASGAAHGLIAANTIIGAVALAIVAGSMASEYSLGTLRNLLVRQPRRLSLLAGKLGALLLGLAATVTVAAGASIGAAVLVAPTQGVSTSNWLSWHGLLASGATWANTMVAVTGFALVGALLAVVVRTPTAAVGIGLAWLLPAEALVTSVWHPARHLLPGQLLQAMASGGSDGVGYRAAVIGSLAVIAGAAALTSTVFARRDVAA
jgi:hypothetical protein